MWLVFEMSCMARTFGAPLNVPAGNVSMSLDRISVLVQSTTHTAHKMDYMAVILQLLVEIDLNVVAVT